MSVNILNINSLTVTSDIIGSSYANSSMENIIYSFFPDVRLEYKIIEKLANLIYLPIIRSTISVMEAKLIVQDRKFINLHGEELVIRFHIRDVQYLTHIK